MIEKKLVITRTKSEVIQRRGILFWIATPTARNDEEKEKMKKICINNSFIFGLIIRAVSELFYYTNIQIYKYTNIQIYKYTNITI